MMKAARNVEEFLARVDSGKRAALERLRDTIKAAAPEAEECISYGVPGFRLRGRYLVGFGAGADHCAFYPGGTTLEPYRKELARYDTSKGTIRFQPEQGLPVRLVRKLVRARIDALRR